MRTRILPLVFACLLGTACASNTQGDEGAPSTARSFSNIIDREELNATSLLGLNTFDAIQRLRPGYLIDRRAGRRASGQLQVSINGGQLSSLTTLNSIPVSTVSEIRYLNDSEAQQRFGTRANGPVILIQLMTQAPGL